MCATAANLVECVLPEVDQRQWVLTFPFGWRLRLGQDGALLGTLTRLFVQTVQAFYAARAAASGVSGAKTGAVTVAQRTSSDLRLAPKTCERRPRVDSFPARRNHRSHSPGAQALHAAPGRAGLFHSTYAKSAHGGPVQNIDHTVSYVYSTWLSQSGRRHTYGADLEMYGHEYHPSSADSVIYYAIPTT
jgi:hypothetical protein